MKFSTIMKKGIAVGLIGVMMAGLVACGSKEESSSSDDASDESGEAVTLQFQQWWGAELPEGYLDDICASFEEETGIKVKILTAASGNYEQTLKAEIAKREAPTLFQYGRNQ